MVGIEKTVVYELKYNGKDIGVIPSEDYKEVKLFYSKPTNLIKIVANNKTILQFKWDKEDDKVEIWKLEYDATDKSLNLFKNLNLPQEEVQWEEISQ